MTLMQRRRALMAGKKAEPELVDINAEKTPYTYNQGQYDYNWLPLTEYPEPETAYRFVVDAEMPEGVHLCIALSGISKNMLYFSAGQNGVETLEKTTLLENFSYKRFAVRHSGGGTGEVSFTIRSIHVYKLPNS